MSFQLACLLFIVPFFRLVLVVPNWNKFKQYRLEDFKKNFNHGEVLHRTRRFINLKNFEVNVLLISVSVIYCSFLSISPSCSKLE